MNDSRTLHLRTQRLHLIAATAELAELETRDVKSLAQELGCAVPAGWPPPLNDENSQRWFREMLQNDPDVVGWVVWYLVHNEPGKERVLIGNAGFKGKPVDGCCEIGYSLLPMYHGNGYGTEAAQALIRWAFQHSEVKQVVAETFAELLPSIRVMEKCGMRHVGAGTPEEGQATVRYAISRNDYP